MASGFQPSQCIEIPDRDWNKCLDTWALPLGFGFNWSLVFCHLICPQSSPGDSFMHPAFRTTNINQSYNIHQSVVLAAQHLNAGSVSRGSPTLWIVLEEAPFLMFPSFPCSWRKGVRAWEWGSFNQIHQSWTLNENWRPQDTEVTATLLWWQWLWHQELLFGQQWKQVHLSISFSSSIILITSIPGHHFRLVSGKQCRDPLFQASLWDNQNSWED